MKSNIKTYFLLSCSMLCWSFSFVWTRIAIASFPPVTLISLRLMIASLLLLAVLLFFRKLVIIKKKDVPVFLLLAFFEPFLYYMGETYGITLVSPTIASVVISTIPLLTPFVTYMTYYERISNKTLFGVVVSLVGVILIFYKPSDNYSATFFGVLLLLVAVFSSIVYSIVLKKITLDYSASNLIFYQSLFGLLYFFPVFLIVDYPYVNNIEITARALGALFALSIFASLFAFIFFVRGIRKIGIVRTNIFVNLIPVFTAVLSVMFLDENVSVLQMFGIVIVVLGLFLSQHLKFFKTNNL